MCGDCCDSERGRKKTGHHRKGHHKRGHGKKGECGCGCSCHGWRNFRTKEEKIDELEDYKSELEKELKAVEERIEELK